MFPSDMKLYYLSYKFLHISFQLIFAHRKLNKPFSFYTIHFWPNTIRFNLSIIFIHICYVCPIGLLVWYYISSIVCSWCQCRSATFTHTFLFLLLSLQDSLDKLNEHFCKFLEIHAVQAKILKISTSPYLRPWWRTSKP